MFNAHKRSVPTQLGLAPEVTALANSMENQTKIRRGRRPLSILAGFVYIACVAIGQTITLIPATITGGASSTGTVTLSAAAPAGGITVTLTSSNSTVAAVPPTVTVAGGSTSAPFTVNTTAVSVSTAVNISGTSSAGSGSGTLTVIPTSPGLVAYWTFDDGTGTTAADSSGNANSMTLFNGINWITGQIGGAISGNGVNQYGSTPVIDLSSTNAVTIAMWVNRTYSTTGGHTFLEDSANFNSSTTGFGVFPDDNVCKGIQAGVHGNVGYTVNCYAQPTSGVWHHLAFVFDKSQSGSGAVTLYVDGVLQTPTQNYLTSANTNNFGANQLFLLSRGGTQEYAAGEVDDLRLYTIALSAAQVQQLYDLGTVTSISVTPVNPSISKGATQQFTATGTYSGGGTQNITSSVTWSSSSTGVATIASGGLATGASAGQSTIQATSGSISGSTTLTVTPPTLVSLSVTPANASIVKSTNQQYTATGTYSDGSTQNVTSSVTWSSTNTAVATISSAGLASGVATGTTTIKATSGSISGSTGLTVTASLVSIAVTPANPSIAKGVTQQFVATGTYSDSSTLNISSSVTWASTNTAAATITSGGLATGAGVGTSTIQATSGSITGSTTVTVTAAILTSIAVAPANTTIASGSTQQYTATGTYSDASTQNLTSSVTWTSTTTSVATITSAGLTTGVAAGNTTIQAVLGSVSGSTTLTVTSTPVPTLLAYWTFNDGSGTTAADSSGNGYTMSLVNGVSWVTGKIGDAISANGTTQYASNSAVNLSSTPTLTVALWLNTTYSTSGGATLIESSTNFNSSTTGFGIFPDDPCGGISVGLHGTGGYNMACYAQPSSGVWHQLVAVLDKTQTGSNVVNLYIDGVLQTATSRPYTTTNTGDFGNNPLYLFARGGTQGYLAGEIDDLRIYNGAMTASEVQQLYQAATISLVSIAVTPANPSIAKGTTQQFTATGTYSDSSTQNITSSVTWSSSSTGVATIASGGLATGASAGQSTIQATSGSISGSTTLTVTPPTQVSLSVTPANASIVKSTNQQYTATGTYSDGSTQNVTSSVTWSSTNTAVATISSAGLASGVATGTTTIKATSGSISGSTGLTVASSALVSITVTPANGSILTNAQQQFAATGTYSDSSTQNITNFVSWLSTNTAAATITTGGLASAVGVGATTIQATSGSISGLTTLTVTAPVLMAISVTPANASIAGGKTEQYTATGTYSDGSTQNITTSVTWGSTNQGVSTITASGLATGVAAGSTTIQATSGSVAGSTNLSVTSAAIFVQWASGDSGSATVSTTYQNNNATSGDLILVLLHWDPQSNVAFVTDNAGNTYTAIGPPTNIGTLGRFQAWYAKNIIGGVQLGVTATFSSKTQSISLVDVIEYAGLDKTAPLDVYGVATGNSVSPDSGPSPVTNFEDETLIGLFGFNAPATPYSAGLGYTFRNYDATSMVEDQPVTTIGSYHATANSSSIVQWFASVIAFKNATQSPVALTANPASITGGGSATGTVTLNSPAPPSGAMVTLTSSNSSVVSVPSSVTVQSGMASTTFPVNTTAVAFTNTVVISATYGAVTENFTITILPGAMSQVATDGFNRANASALGVSWTPLVGAQNVTVQVVNDQIESTATGPKIGKELYYGGLNWSPDQYSQVQIVAASGAGGGYEGPAVRMTSNDTYYSCVVYNVGTGNATVAILLDNAGTYTTLATSSAATVKAGDVIQCTVEGSSLSMTDQTASVTLVTASDSTIPSGYPGIVDNAGSVATTNYVMANWAGGLLTAALAVQELASDNFDRANALNLGSNWDVGTGHGPIQIVSQEIQPYPAGGTQPSKEHYVAYGPVPNDQWSQFQVVVHDTFGTIGAELRASDSSDTMYVCLLEYAGSAATPGDPGNRIDRILNGSITPLVIDQQWATAAPGDYIRGQVQGSLISMIDVSSGALLLTAFDTNITSGYPGVSLAADTGNPSDHIAANWSGGTFH